MAEKSQLELEIKTSLAAGSEAALKAIKNLFKGASTQAKKFAQEVLGISKVSAKKPLNEGAKAGYAFGRSMDSASKSTDKLGKVVKAMPKRPLDKGFPDDLFAAAKAANKTATELEKLGKATTKTKKGGKDLKDWSKAGKKSVKELGDEAKKTTGILGVFKTGVSSIANSLRSFASYAAGASIFAGLIGGIYKATESMIEYDQALHDLKAITQATDVETARMGETIKSVAATTKFSTVEIAEGMKTLGQAGFTAEEAIRGIQGISDLATGTITSMADSVDLVSTAIRAFGMDASEAANVSDIFANAINGSKLTMEKLRVSFNYIGPIAKLAGVELKELTSMMMMLANKGIRASTIGTGLRQVLNKILKPTESFTKAVSAAGLTMDDLNPKTNNLRDIIARLGLVVEDADDAFKFFGMRGAAAVSALIEGGAPQFEAMSTLVDRTGIAAKMAGEQLRGLGLRIKQLQDKFTVFFAELRDQGFAEPLGWLVDGARHAMDAMILFARNGLAPVIKWLTVLGTVIVGMTFINLIRGSTLCAAAFVKLSVATATTVKALNSAALSARAFLASIGPLGWVLMATGAALTAIVIGIRGYSERLKEVIGISEKVMDATERLGVSISKTRVNLYGVEEGSKEYKQELKKLKDEIESTAKEFPRLQEEADKVVASMDILNGKFTDGKQALENFEQALSEIQFDAATDRIKAFDKQLEGSIFWRFITGKIKLGGMAIAETLWHSSTLGSFIGIADRAIDALSEKYTSVIDLITSKIVEADALTFSGMEEASKKGGKDLEDFNKLLQEGKEYMKAWAKEQGIALQHLSTEEINKLAYTIDVTTDVSKRMRISMVKGAIEISETLKKQDISGQISQWREEFDEVGQSFAGLSSKISKQGDMFGPFKKALDSVVREEDWGRLFDLDMQKVYLAAELKDIERLYSEHLIDYKEYAERKYTVGKKFNETDRQLRTDEKFNVIQQFANLKAARDKELADLEVHRKRYTKEKQEQMRLEIDDRYTTKAVNLLYQLDEKRKKASDKYLKTEEKLRGVLKDGWEKHYDEIAQMDKDLAKEKQEISEELSESILQNNISLNRKLRDLKSGSLKEELKSATASKDVFADISNARKALAKQDKESALVYAKSAQKGLSGLGNVKDAKRYAEMIAKIYQKSGKKISEYQVDLQNDVRAVRDKELLATKLDAKAKNEMARDLSNARRALEKGDAEAATKYAKSAEASLSDVKDVNAVIKYVGAIRGIMQEAEKAIYTDKREKLEAEYNDKKIKREADMKEKQIDHDKLMLAAKDLFTTESAFLDDLLAKQKKNTAESLKGTEAQVRMYEAARKTAKEIAGMSKGGEVSPTGYAAGGPVFARPSDPYVTSGSGHRDDVPALLKKNEFVFQQSAVARYGKDLLYRMNNGLVNLQNWALPIQKFALGGPVGGSNSGTGESFINVNLNLPVQGRAIQTRMTKMDAGEFVRQLKTLERLGS